jgi:hypothetical protein
MSDAPEDAPDSFEEEVSRDEVASAPNETADPQSIVDAAIPADIRAKYEIYSYRSAAVILSQSHPAEFEELMETLREFSITTTMIRTAGGNESDIPKLLTAKLRPLGWHETVVQGDLVVRRFWKEKVRTTKGGTIIYEKKTADTTRPKFLDGHKIDYVKGKVAFDLEWNSKDQTYDRDLYAFAAFATCGVVDVGVLVTRGVSLNPIFKKLGPALKKNGSVEYKKNGQERPTADKYGASTTWMGKLLYRLNAGRNAGCPVLAIGITPACIEDLP